MKTILPALRVAVLTGVLATSVTLLAHVAEARGRDRADAYPPPPPAPQAYTYGDDDNGRGRGRGRGGDDARPYVPLESIIGRIQAQTPGRLVGVRGPNGQGIYRIIWETPDGRVITFVVDGRTGQILR